MNKQDRQAYDDYAEDFNAAAEQMEEMQMQVLVKIASLPADRRNELLDVFNSHVRYENGRVTVDSLDAAFDALIENCQGRKTLH